MSNILNSVDLRTNLVGQNRMELLLFRLNSEQFFGINVFKVREVSLCPKLRSVPYSSQFVKGIFNFRGEAIPAVDLSDAIGLKPIDNLTDSLVIISEYNQSVQGLIVREVEKIINITWQNIKPPPPGTGKDSYLTAITEHESRLIEILDVEKVLWEISGKQLNISEELISAKNFDGRKYKPVYVLDDSQVARNQLTKTLSTLNLKIQTASNGEEGLKHIFNLLDKNPDKNLSDFYSCIISDIEMPSIDGYTVCSKLRSDERTKHMPIILHTSLSGAFNEQLISKVKATKFIRKFNANEIIDSVTEVIVGHVKK